MTAVTGAANRSEEHTSELQSHSEISYAVFCLKKKNKQVRSEEHTSELQSHSESSYAVFSLKKKNWLRRNPRPISSLHTSDPERRLPRRSSSVPIRTVSRIRSFFFCSAGASHGIYTNLNTLSLHDALPI